MTRTVVLRYIHEQDSTPSDTFNESSSLYPFERLEADEEEHEVSFVNQTCLGQVVAQNGCVISIRVMTVCAVVVVVVSIESMYWQNDALLTRKADDQVQP